MLWNLENEDFEIMTQPYFAQVPFRSFEEAQNFSEGLCVVGYYAAGQHRNVRGSWDGGWQDTDKDSFFGFLNKYGDLELAPRFKVAHNFSEGFAYVEDLDSKVNTPYTSPGYYINHFGTDAFENVRASGNDFSCGHALVGPTESARFIDTKGNFTSDYLNVFTWTEYTMDPQNGLLYDAILNKSNYKLGNGLIRCKAANSNKFGFVNHEGDFKIPAIFDFAFPMSEGIARVMHGTEVAFINKEGHRVGDRTYLAAGDFSEGLASVRFIEDTGTAYDGVIDSKGDLVFKREIKDLDYNVRDISIGPYSCGRAAFYSEKESGYFDTSGNLHLKGKYFGLHNFKEGFAWVAKKGPFYAVDGLALIDLEGNERFYLHDAYTAGEFSEGISAVQSTSGPWGFVRKRNAIA